MERVEFLRHALDPSPQPILTASLGGTVSWSNHAARAALGDMVGKRLSEDTASGDVAAKKTLTLAGGTSRRLHISLRFGEVSSLWHVWRVDTFPADVEPFLIFESDAAQNLISKFILLKHEAVGMAEDREREAETARRLRKEAAHLLRLSQTDRLTGLMNRAGFEAYTRSVLGGTSNSGMFLFSDLDGFKRTNDEFGHDAGDAVLREIAARYSREIRSQDRVARLGGDEFAFWFHGMTRGDVGATISRLEELAALPIVWKDVLRGELIELRVGASFGRAFAPKEGSTFEALKALSDKRMYKNKRWRKRDGSLPGYGARNLE